MSCDFYADSFLIAFLALAFRPISFDFAQDDAPMARMLITAYPLQKFFDNNLLTQNDVVTLFCYFFLSEIITVFLFVRNNVILYENLWRLSIQKIGCYTQSIFCIIFQFFDFAETI